MDRNKIPLSSRPCGSRTKEPSKNSKERVHILSLRESGFRLQSKARQPLHIPP